MMTSDQLREWLDAHGVDGGPDGTRGATWVIAECRNRPGWPAFIRVVPAVAALTMDVVRHAPLPDFGAMARELEELRARVPAICGCVHDDVDCSECHGRGAVWVTP